MADISLGFGDRPQRTGGMFGSTGRSIYAATHGGGMGAFFNPEPFLSQERRGRDIGALREAWAANADQIQRLTQAIDDGDIANANKLLTGIAEVFTSHYGIDPNKTIVPIFQNAINRSMGQHLQGAPGSPEYSQSAVPFAGSVAEAVNIGEMGSGNLLRTAETGAAKARTDLTAEQLRQTKEGFPLEQKKTQAQIDAETARTGLSTEQLRQTKEGFPLEQKKIEAQTEAERARSLNLGEETTGRKQLNQYFQQHQMHPPTAAGPGGAARRPAMVETVDAQGNPVTKVLPENVPPGQEFQKYVPEDVKVSNEALRKSRLGQPPALPSGPPPVAQEPAAAPAPAPNRPQEVPAPPPELTDSKDLVAFYQSRGFPAGEATEIVRFLLQENLRKRAAQPQPQP